MAAPTTLIGRDDILERASALLDGPSGGVVLVGEGGVGKSRIAVEVLRRGQARGFHAVSTVGTQAAAAVPLGALSHLLPDLTEATGNVLAAARASLEAQAGDRRLMIAVDDAHLLDDHSAALLLQLSMSMPSFVVATVRTGEPVPDPILALWKEGIAERVEVGRLDDDSIERLTTDVLGGPVEPHVGRVVAERADGNPLVARELCLAGRDTGAIAERDGRWALVGELRVSARLAELVSARVRGLGDAERRAIELIAHGEPLGYRVTQTIADAAALLDLERRGLVVLREDGRRRELWLSHPIYAEVVRATTGAMLAASLKAELAGAVSATGMRRRTDLLRVATWRLEGGAGDVDLLRRAAAETYRAGDMVGTARLAAGAWDIAPDAASGLLLATALAFSGRYEEADAIFDAAADLVRDDGERTRIAMVHAAILSAGMGQPEAAIALLADAESAVHDTAERDLLRGQRAHLLALDGQVDAVLDLAEPLAATADGALLVTTAMAAVIAYARAGAFERLIELAERALPDATQQWAAGAVSISPAMLQLEADGARVQLGDLDAHERRAASLDGHGATDGMVEAGPTIVNRPVAVLRALHLASAAVVRGRPRTARDHVRGVSPVATDLLGPPAMAMLALCAALTGRPEDAAADLARAIAWRRPGSIFDPFLDPAQVWTLVVTGRPEEARRHAEASVQRSIEAHQWHLALDLAHDLARIGGVDVARSAMDRIGDRVDGALAAARVAHVVALARDDADDLEAASKAFASIGAELLAAEAATAAARAARRVGQARRATGLLRAASELAARCEGARTPALLVPDDELTPLSRRELEVAELAVQGLPSEEIAARLFLSVRTVDNHLQHVYQKLGIGSRAELRAALGRNRSTRVD